MLDVADVFEAERVGGWVERAAELEVWLVHYPAKDIYPVIMVFDGPIEGARSFAKIPYVDGW